MARRFTGRRLVIASHNLGKVHEFEDLLRPFGVAAVGAAGLGLAEPKETGSGFLANAEIKARAAAESTAMPALADDSGLVVPALGGAPGTQSARWAGANRDFKAAMARLEKDLEGKGDRRAYFQAALVLCWPDGHCERFEGRVHGRLLFPPRGKRGFGFDPVFAADGHELTFAEMEPAAKHAISHRGEAFRKLAAACLRRK